MAVALLGCTESPPPDDTEATGGVGPQPTAPSTPSPESAASSTPSPESFEPGPNYTYEVHAGCGERGGFFGFYRVQVDDRSVIAVKPLNRWTQEIPARQALSIAGLVEHARMEERQGADVVKIVADADGILQRVRIDRIRRGIDDEECYRVTKVVRVVY